MSEEAGFIAAVLTDPDDRTALLVYADWLDDRNDPRGEYLRMLATENPDRVELARLRTSLDPCWTSMIANRRYRVGRQVRLLAGAFIQSEGELIAVAPDWQNGIVRVMLWGRPVQVEQSLVELELVN